MKVSKEQVRENRMRVVETASELFRERGYDGIGISELMSEAGLTHGGFYKHFGSKADLLSEAMNCGFTRSAEKRRALIGKNLLNIISPDNIVMTGGKAA